jgi:hypothetical protein
MDLPPPEQGNVYSSNSLELYLQSTGALVDFQTKTC